MSSEETKNAQARADLEQEIIIRITTAALRAMAKEGLLCDRENPGVDALGMMSDAAVHLFCALLTAVSHHDPKLTSKNLVKSLALMRSEYIPWHLEQRLFPPGVPIHLDQREPEGSA
jgi:hypothetical protein